MRIFNKIFIFPILMSCRVGLHTTDPDFKFWTKKCKTAGTMKFTTYVLGIETKNKKRQFSFCWRPDVTRYYWQSKKV